MEQFGRVLIEAMACGVPVVASEVSSLPEVVGDTGLLINPYDDEALAQAILKIITNADIRQQLSLKAQARSMEFTWGKCARQTVEVYRQAAKGC